MKKTLLHILILLLSISLFGCTNEGNEALAKKEGQPQENQQQAYASDEAAVTSLVEYFGGQLQKVSLQAPDNIVTKDIQENYGELVSPALLSEWLRDPANAPGRVLSSPWPDRIDILSIEKLSESAYEVKGEIIEITSVEIEKGGVAARQPITLVVEKNENRWLINTIKLGAYEDANPAVYRNTQYGFNFFLPASWQGYSIITDSWNGSTPGDPQGSETVETGPMISIRHPQWTAQNQRQDIPIMIFTHSQWNSLQQRQFHIGAAPIGPKELARNTKYVFALPARYNYAFPAGYEEVETILESNPLQVNEDYLDK